MNNQIDRNSSVPLQFQLYLALKEWFTGDFEPDDMLPTEIEIAARFKVGRGTVRIALDRLTKEGIIHRTAGRGTFLDKNFFIRMTRYRVGVILSRREFGSSKAREYTWVHHMEMINGIFAESLNLNISCELIPEETVTPGTVENFDGFILFRGISEEVKRFLSKPLVRLHYEIDLYGGIEQITRHIIDHQYGKIGYIGSLEKGRLEIVNQILSKEAGLVVSPDACVECDGADEDGYQAGVRLLNQTEALDCIICSTDLRAIGLLRALKERGISVPGQVSVYGFDGIRKSEISDPPLSTCQFNWKSPGLFAVKEIRAILDHRAAPAFVPLQGELIIRSSSRGSSQ